MGIGCNLGSGARLGGLGASRGSGVMRSFNGEMYEEEVWGEITS